VLVGSREFIDQARRNRKLVGGGMRQAGSLAAAGLVALDTMTERLVEDHDNARLLAEGIAEMPQFEIDLASVQSNMVFFSLRDDTGLTASELAERLKAHNIWLMAMGERRFRAVLHYWIRPEHVIQILVALQKELS
jgi:threonine aldolase